LRLFGHGGLCVADIVEFFFDKMLIVKSSPLVKQKKMLSSYPCHPFSTYNEVRKTFGGGSGSDIAGIIKENKRRGG
jgi:hypothetical protein